MAIPTRVLLLVVTGLMQLAHSSPAQAAQICNSVPECLALQERIEMQIRDLHIAATPRFLPLEKGPKGQLLTMSFNEAIKYCARRGGRLPSARDLAGLSMVLGAKGIIDESWSSCRDRGGEIVEEVTYADRSHDDFCFSNRGYPEGGVAHLKNDFFWSSTLVGVGGYVLEGYTGSLSFQGHSYIGKGGIEMDAQGGAVLCAVNQK